MQSNNPVFRNSDEFNGRATNAYGNQVYGGSGAAHQGYGTSTAPDPSTWGVGTPGAPGTHQPYGRQADTRPMTIDSVVQKTGLALLVVIVTAFATWVVTPAITENGTLSQSAISQLYAAMTIGGLDGVRAVDGQLLQAGDQPRAGAALLRRRGRRARRLQQVLRRTSSAAASSSRP